MDYDFLFDKIELCDETKAVFWDLHKRVGNKKFSDSVKLAYILFRRGDDLFAPFLEKFAKEENVTPERMNLYLYFRFGEHLYEEYKHHGFDDEIFYANMKDISGVGPSGIDQPKARIWFRRIFALSQFKIGCLVFEIVPAIRDAEIEGFKIQKGELCITTHIPRKKLDDALCEESYEKARRLFSSYLGLERIFIFCTSWLIHPFLSECLPEDSGIVKFQSKYKLLKALQDEESVITRVFPKICENIDDYPEDTTLRKIVKHRLKNKLPLGIATGVRL